jgi:hypothetical protein
MIFSKKIIFLNKKIIKQLAGLPQRMNSESPNTFVGQILLILGYTQYKQYLMLVWSH